jgi:hypothetical protein
MDKLKGKSIDLSTMEEGIEGASGIDVEDRKLLDGFKQLNVKIHLLADQDITALRTKSKYEGLFDIGVLSL